MLLSLSSISPVTIYSINLGTSTPAVSPSINLSQFTELTSFNGGTNSLRSITGFSYLGNLQEMTLGTVLSTVNFEYKDLPVNLKLFSVTTESPQLVCQIKGTFKDLPRSLENLEGASNNTFLSGDIADLPRTLKTTERMRSGYYWGSLSSTPPNMTNLGLATNSLSNSISGRFIDLPSSLVELSLYETRVTDSCQFVWSEIPSTLKQLTLTTANVSGSILDADHLETLSLGRNMAFFPVSSISIEDLPRNLTYLFSQCNLRGSINSLPSSLSGVLTIASPVSGTLAGIPAGVTEVSIGGSTAAGWWGNAIVSGNINLLNTPVLTKLTLAGANTVTGNLSGLPRSLTNYVHTNTQNNMSGDISGLPASLVYYDNRGSASTVFGSVENLPRNLTYFSQQNNSSTIGGNLSGLPSSLTDLFLVGTRHNIKGRMEDLPRSLDTFSVTGSAASNGQTTSGNLSGLPSTLVTYSNTGANTVTGDIQYLPQSIVSFTIAGNQTIGGNLSGLSNKTNLTTFSVSNTSTTNGLHSLFGNLSSLPSSLRTLNITGRKANFSYYDGFTTGFEQKTWTDSVQSFTFNVSSGTFPASHLSTLLVDLTACNWTQSTRVLNVGDSSMPIISMSGYPLARQAIEFLRLPKASGGRGVTVTVLTAA
jgi:hypothetical protein